jgi:hypothetical protein
VTIRTPGWIAHHAHQRYTWAMLTDFQRGLLQGLILAAMSGPAATPQVYTRASRDTRSKAQRDADHRATQIGFPPKGRAA